MQQTPTPWKTGDLDYLKQHYPNKKLTVRRIAQQLERSVASVKCKANELGLKRAYKWSEEELWRLQELAGEMPRSQLYQAYNKWAVRHGFPPRHSSTIENKIKAEKIASRLNSAADWYTSADLACFLGCAQDTASHWLKQYQRELKPVEAAHTKQKLAVSRRQFRKFLLRHPSIVERYRRTVDLVWLVDLLGEK